MNVDTSCIQDVLNSLSFSKNNKKLKFESTVEMDFWRGAARKSRIERIRNAEIRRMIHANRTIMDEIEHRRLKWYGHLQRMKDGRIPKAVDTWKIERSNRRGRPRAMWVYNVQQTMRKFGVTDQDSEEREQWRNLIKENL